MEKIKVGIIGCGCIANAAHIPAYLNNPEVEIKYFCDILPEKAQAAVEKYGVGTAVEDYHVVLNDPEIQGVSICTPNLMHSIISCDALRAGKHVLCEKPAARIYSEALEMQKVQHETGKTLNIGVVNRFKDCTRAIKKRIDDGDLGEVYHVYVSFRAHRSIPGLGGAFTTKAIAGGGALIDWGVHYIDIVMFCLGDPQPLTVSGRQFCKLGVDMKNYVYKNMWSEVTKNVETGTYDVDDSVTAFVRTQDSAAITIHGAWAQNIGVSECYIDFMGTKGGIRLQYGGNYTFYGTKDGQLYEETPEPFTDNMWNNEINAFVDSIKNGTKQPSHIDNVIITAKLMQGIYDSSDANREIVF
ncbi:MAG: Gfo/Idh/MocA family oxidoreductase [Ruminococcaceae bacterium]|nr:Gfo/Idh/MocA family oxidoreductase [Oscillospiraceae bacterium]